MVTRIAPTLWLRQGEVIVPSYRFSVGPVEERLLGGLGMQPIDQHSPICLRPVHMADLIESCYGDDPEGGPQDPAQIIRELIFRLNRCLRECGWRIQSVGDHRFVLRQCDEGE